MKKLEDIPKKTVFKVPDGYFEQLPTVIQARMAEEAGRSPLAGVFSFSLKYALPAIALVVAGIVWFRPEPSIEGQLGEIDADQIALYLDNTYANEIAIASEESLVEWTEEELNALEDDVYSNMEFGDELEDVLDDIDL
jgi:hypothetical protein